MIAQTFDEVTRQIEPLVAEKLQHQTPQKLRDLTVDVIWETRGKSGTRLTPALVDLALRQLERLGRIRIADDGGVSLPRP